MPHRLHIVDVFAERPYAGNPLAVVLDADDLSTETMQLIAAEMNFSETTFVSAVQRPDSGYAARIFTPARELAFAGHPILGAAWVIRHHVASNPEAMVRLNLPVGQVPVTFEPSDDGREVAWFLAPPVTLGAICSRERIAAALGLAADDIDPKTPVQQLSAGTSALLVPVRDLAALRRSRLNLAAFAPLARDGFPPLVYVFCAETHHAENDLCARFFFEAHEVREDPAAGNATAFLGVYLLEHGGHPASGLSLRIEQGYEIRRPSLLLLRARKVGGVPEVQVGGHVIPTVQGELL